MICQFCSQESEVTCSAFARIPVLVFPEEILKGDVYHASDGHSYLVFAVRAVELAGEPAWALSVRRRKRLFVWFVFCGALPLIVGRRLPCAARCCWKHYREVADGDYRCKDHWMMGAKLPGKSPERGKSDNRSNHKSWRGHVETANRK